MHIFIDRENVINVNFLLQKGNFIYLSKIFPEIFPIVAVEIWFCFHQHAYAKLLWEQIPKAAHKDYQVISVFLRFWDLSGKKAARKTLVKSTLDISQKNWIFLIFWFFEWGTNYLNKSNLVRKLIADRSNPIIENKF